METQERKDSEQKKEIEKITKEIRSYLDPYHTLVPKHVLADWEIRLALAINNN